MEGLGDAFLARLRDDLIQRRIASGLEYLERNRSALESLDPARSGAGVLLGRLAQWVDIGFAGTELLRCVLARFSRESRGSLPLLDFLHVKMAEGLLAFQGEEPDQAIRSFEVAASLAEEAGDAELLTISNFWIGRCLRQEGRYDDALNYTVRAREAAAASGYGKIAAVIQVLESWLIFQKNKLREAERILRDAEAVLEQTDDYISRGNIQSAYGRIARREGRYDRALEHFERAISLYKERDAHHRNLARSLVNMASVKRLVAVQLQRKLDRDAARRRERARSHRTGSERERLERLRREAFSHLEEAAAIYAGHPTHHGTGAIHINRGFLYLDSGELDRAGEEAGSAFRLGEEKRDYILMARARILACIVENAKFEEQIEELAGPSMHAQLAAEYARDAVEFARRTQNPRLLARAYIWQGLTFSNEFFDDANAARECCDAATALLKPDVRDYIWDDLQELRSRVLKKGPIDTVLQEWSQGLVGGKTFQQITEEFAGIIIPKVWEREGRKVSRVAAKLSVSPKKVRRVLQAGGLLKRE